MCVYNGETHLREAVESILNQTFYDFELVIVDDGSTDSSWQILSEYSAKDSRIVLIQNEANLGLEKSLNKGLAATKGEYFARQDADDVSGSNRLQLQVDFLDNHPEVGALGTAVELIDEQGNTIGKNSLPTDRESLQSLLLFNNFMHHSTLMVRSSLMQKLGGYDETMRYVEDYDLWWRLSCLSGLTTLPNLLLKRRVDDGPRISKLYREKQLQNSFEISWKALCQSLGEDSLNLNKKVYERFWWNLTQFIISKQDYQKSWSDKQGENALIQKEDIQQLQPLWRLLATFPGASETWGCRIQKLAYQLLQQKQTMEGFELLGIAVARLKMPFQLSKTIRALVKPYVPESGQQLWRVWKNRKKNVDLHST
jgi:glycosyltransferase involved in cell wall biosynthesis